MPYRAITVLLASAVLTVEPAWASEPAQDPPGTEENLEWYNAWAHAVRLDIGMGRWTGKDLGAAGFGLQIEWWPRETLSFTVRAWMHDIRAQSPIQGVAPAFRDASGAAIGVQIANPGRLKFLAGASAGLAAVHGDVPPAKRASPIAGVIEGHGGIVLMHGRITTHVLAWAHLYSEGPPVFSLSFGGGAVMHQEGGIQQEPAYKWSKRRRR